MLPVASVQPVPVRSTVERLSDGFGRLLRMAGAYCR